MHPRQVVLRTLSYVENKFPKDYEPTVFDNLTTTIKIDGKIINLGLWYCWTYLGTLLARKSSDDLDRLHTLAQTSLSSLSQLLTLRPLPTLAKK